MHCWCVGEYPAKTFQNTGTCRPIVLLLTTDARTEPRRPRYHTGGRDRTKTLYPRPYYVGQTHKNCGYSTRVGLIFRIGNSIASTRVPVAAVAVRQFLSAPSNHQVVSYIDHRRRPHGARGGTCPPLWQIAGHRGGGTVSRRMTSDQRLLETSFSFMHNNNPLLQWSAVKFYAKQWHRFVMQSSLKRIRFIMLQ